MRSSGDVTTPASGTAHLLLQAEEAVWAGDKAAEGRLKSLITSKIQMIEAKGIDPIRVTNYVRLVMTSNEDWVVPAGMDERRFAVFDIAPTVKGNFAYFKEMGSYPVLTSKQYAGRRVEDEALTRCKSTTTAF